ncbi:conserved hypothetical protein [Vibrio nigripulchritudo SOn1]|uniref:Pyridoxamine 5'-phosphate oxidase putative domain-containing protein n=1 Tax=Vibrio nigripulchritudo SOn1 TaxID=1238450 RepID=A0AAV2W173_9VIBR|nr:hypothetical protein [Vibrio nigripulchritudo]CCO50241.1 conserved hypothetical protein [Vibrio nigripulchritudo SOn1]
MTEKANQELVNFLRKSKLLTLCTSNGDQLWAANLIFNFNESDMSAVVSTSVNTRHSEIMNERNIVAGTIGSKLSLLSSIGLQYSGNINLIDEPQRSVAKKQYLKRYPFLRGKVSDLWILKFDEIKLVSMRLGKRSCIEWLRENGQ